MFFRTVVCSAIAATYCIGVSASSVSAAQIGQPISGKPCITTIKPVVIVPETVKHKDALPPEMLALIHFEFAPSCPGGSLGGEAVRRPVEVIAEVPLIDVSRFGVLLSTVVPQFVWR